MVLKEKFDEISNKVSKCKLKEFFKEISEKSQ